MCIRIDSGGGFRVADRIDGPIKIKSRVILRSVTGTANLLHNTARALSAQTDNKAVAFGLGLLNMALARTVTGLALHARAALCRVATLSVDAGHKTIQFAGCCIAVRLQTGMRG